VTAARSILIVEDDHDTRVALRELLEEVGYEVLSAADGRSGIEILARQKPTMVLLDLMMPVMDGWQFLRAKAEDPELASVPVIVMSASGRRADPVPGAYIEKPICMDRLLPLANRFCAESASSAC
jgi:CheY-like chemotaxis protein